jgi:hypothetical protein
MAFSFCKRATKPTVGSMTFFFVSFQLLTVILFLLCMVLWLLSFFVLLQLHRVFALKEFDIQASIEQSSAIQGLYVPSAWRGFQFSPQSFCKQQYSIFKLPIHQILNHRIISSTIEYCSITLEQVNLSSDRSPHS